MDLPKLAEVPDPNAVKCRVSIQVWHLVLVLTQPPLYVYNGSMVLDLAGKTVIDFWLWLRYF